jgi:hypothetical protein
MALLFSATDECSRPMVRIIPRHFHWLRKLRSPIFLKAFKAIAFLPCFAGAELNCFRYCHARKRIAQECWKFVALEQPWDELDFAICSTKIDRPPPS